MATINTTTWQYTYTDKNWKTQTATIKNWSNVTDSQVQQLTNAANNSGGRMTVTNDTSNAGYWKQRWTGNLMYNWQAAITNMASDGNGYAITTYSDWTRSYNNQATWEKISENTYKSILANTNALWLNSSVKWLSNTYWDLGGASSKPKYQWFGTMTGYNPSLTVANLWGGYQFGTMAEQAEKNSPWYLEWRNNELASALLNSGITDQAWIRNFLSQYEWFTSYDATGQNNTVQAIYNRIGQMQSGLGNKEEDMLGDQIMQGQYRDTVNSILNSAFGIGNMDSIKDMYGSDVYYSMMNALKDVEWTWNATDPASRSQLEWYLQEIIGSAVGTWVDQSKLNLAMNAILSNFTDAAQKQIQQDVLAVQNLQTKWMSADQIAKQTWMSKDQVNQLVLLSQWMPSQIWKYYEMNNDAEDLITEDYERNRENLEQQYKFNLEVANQELTQMREDFNKTYLDQQEANENTLHNMDLIAWMTGTWYSRRWLEGMSYAQQQANAVLNNLMDNYDRNNLDIANSIKSMTMAYRQNDAELVDQMNDAILNAKNNYIAQVSNIQSKYWLVWLEWQQAIAQAVQWFVDQAETIYNNAFNRAWTNTNNLISAVSNIWAIEQQQMQTKQMKIAEFQQDSMYMTQNQLRDYAQKNWLQMEYQQLVWYQQEATINTLNSVSPWLWNQYANKISQMLSKWYTPQQAVSEILNSDEVKWSGWQVQWNYFVNPQLQQAISFEQAAAGNVGTSWMWMYDTQAIQQEIWNYANQYVSWFQEWQLINGQKKQCWAFVNDYLQSMWLGRVFTDPIDKKAAAINSDTPTVWSVVVMTSPTQPQYWHVGIVKSIDYNAGTMTIAQTNYNGDWAYHESTVNLNSNKILWYYDPAIAMAWQGGWWINGSNVSDYDINTMVMRIGRTAYWANISNEESKRVEKVIRDWFAQWKDQTWILWDVMWYSIDPQHQDMWNAIINTLQANWTEKWLSDYDMVWLARQINQWNYGNAVVSMEKQVAKKTWNTDMNDKEALAVVANNIWDDLISMIQDNMNKMGIVQWNVNKRKRKLARDSEWQQIASKLTALVSDWRKQMAWSNVTERELQMLNELLPAIKDNPYNAITKIQEFQDYMINSLNSTRSVMNLPNLDKNTLMNKTARANLYLWGWTSTSNWWGRWL